MGALGGWYAWSSILFGRGMENSPATGDGGLFSQTRATLPATSWKSVTPSLLAVQSLLKSALHLNAMVEHLEHFAGRITR